MERVNRSYCGERNKSFCLFVFHKRFHFESNYRVRTKSFGTFYNIIQSQTGRVYQHLVNETNHKGTLFLAFRCITSLSRCFAHLLGFMDHHRKKSKPIPGKVLPCSFYCHFLDIVHIGNSYIPFTHRAW